MFIFLSGLGAGYKAKSNMNMQRKIIDILKSIFRFVEEKDILKWRKQTSDMLPLRVYSSVNTFCKCKYFGSQ